MQAPAFMRGFWSAPTAGRHRITDPARMRHVHTWILAAPLLVGSMVLAHAAFTPVGRQAPAHAAVVAGGQDACARKAHQAGKVPTVTAMESPDPACEKPDTQ